MPTNIDIAFALFFAIVVAGFEAFYFDRRFKAQVAAGVPDARTRAYCRAIIGQWVIAIAALILWAGAGRPWATLGITPSHDRRSYFAVGLIVALVVIGAHQFRSIRRLKPEHSAAIRTKFAGLEFLLPHTRGEYRLFMALSITAGICEELLYRGYLTWLLAVYVGLPASIAVVVLAFGLAHAYQGPSGVLKTGLVGLVMSLIVVGTGWLFPAMLVHALIDLSSGYIGYTVMNQPADASLLGTA
jgi:membrane protease YdiL (CAAX protease family)